MGLGCSASWSTTLEDDDAVNIEDNEYSDCKSTPPEDDDCINVEDNECKVVSNSNHQTLSISHNLIQLHTFVYLINTRHESKSIKHKKIQRKGVIDIWIC